MDLELHVIGSTLELLDHLPAHILLTINASPATILSERLDAMLRERPCHRIVLEITEHAAVEDYAALQSRLSVLRLSGVKVAIDDAGAGYSGLRQIVQLEPDIIKLDMSLTRGIDDDPARRALASAMIFFARETGSIVVAEGVETQAELLTLRTLGVTGGQGYLLGKPQPHEQYHAATMLQKRA